MTPATYTFQFTRVTLYKPTSVGVIIIGRYQNDD